MENKITGVTFILIRPSNEILMQLRDGNSKRYPNMWCFPGGHLDSDGDPIKTVIREVKEEYDLNIVRKNCQELMVHQLPYSVSAKVFICKVGDNQIPKLYEGAAMKWMKIDKIKKIELGFQHEAIVSRLDYFLRRQKV